MSDEGKTPGYDDFEPTPDLMRGDVGLGDLIEFRSGYKLVRGRVEESASDGGVLGIYVDGKPYSAGLYFVRLIRKASEVDLLAVRITHLERQVTELIHTVNVLGRTR